MQKIETLNKELKRAYKITFTATELDDEVTSKLMETLPNFDMKGFRKGKVPLALLRKQFGKSLFGETVQKCIDGAINDHFLSSGDKPAGIPDVQFANQDWKEGDDIEVSLAYDCLPAIPDVDFSKFKLEKLIPVVEDTDIEKSLELLAQNTKNFADRKKGTKAKNGDQVLINFTGSIDGKSFEGNTAENFPVVLGSNRFIPGFDEQLIGAKAGDDVDVKVTFPEGYGDEHTSGKDAEFKCGVIAVRSHENVEINDEFAKQYGKDNLDEVREILKEELEASCNQEARVAMQRQLMDQISKMVTFELPEAMLEQEAKDVAHTLWLEENPDAAGDEPPELKPTKEHIEIAERRIRLGLVMADVGTKQNITATQADMEQHAIKTARQYYPGMEQEYLDTIQKNKDMQQRLSNTVFESKVIDYVLELVDINEIKMSPDDLMDAAKAITENG